MFNDAIAYLVRSPDVRFFGRGLVLGSALFLITLPSDVRTESFSNLLDSRSAAVRIAR